MIDPVSGVAGATSASHLQLVPGEAAATTATGQRRNTASTGARATSVKTPAAAPATRVYIDRSVSGVYVYQLVNASTGQVLVELPRAESETLNVLDGYEPGAATQVSA